MTHPESDDDRVQRLTDAYMRDLEVEIATINERAAERADPQMRAYRDTCAAELAALRAASSIRIDRYGVPHPVEKGA